MENISPDILEIIILHLQKEASQPEEEQLLAWLNESPQNKASFDEVESIWLLSGPESGSSEFDVSAAWAKVKNKTIESEPLVTKSKTKIIQFPDWYWKVAASLLLILGIGYFFQNAFLKEETWTSVVTTGEKRIVKLPDSSTVWLNKNSRISYSDFSGERRLVKLEGEAFFEVARKPDQPFQISGLESLTQVLGTSFNLRSRKDGHDELEVVSGLVAFSHLNQPELVLKLKPGQKGAINDQGKVLETKVIGQNFRSWQTDQINFENAGLDEVCKELERYFSVEIQVENKSISNCRFTGNFDKPTLNELLQILSLSLELQVEEKGSILILKGKGCP